MPDVLIGAPPNEETGSPVEPAEIERKLNRIGYHVRVKQGCVNTVNAALAAESTFVTAIVLDSKLVALSLKSQEYPRGILVELRRVKPNARIITYLSRPYDGLPEDVQDAVRGSDAIVDMPTDASEVAEQVAEMLAHARRSQ